jgi:hypothetical protein
MSENAKYPPFIKDRPILLLVILNSVLALLNLITTLARLRSHDFKVPVQYLVRDGSVITTSNWYSLYGLAIFSVIGMVLNIMVARKMHESNRWFAFIILLLYILVSVVTFLIINAILGLVSRV